MRKLHTVIIIALALFVLAPPTTAQQSEQPEKYLLLSTSVNGRRKVNQFSTTVGALESSIRSLPGDIDGEEDAGCGRCGKPRSSRFSKLPVGALFASMGSVGVHGPGVGRQRCVRVA